MLWMPQYEGRNRKRGKFVEMPVGEIENLLKYKFFGYRWHYTNKSHQVECTRSLLVMSLAQTLEQAQIRTRRRELQVLSPRVLRRTLPML